MRTSEITIKYVLNRLYMVLSYHHPYQPSENLYYHPSQAQGDVGFLWTDTGDDIAKNMLYYIIKFQLLVKFYDCFQLKYGLNIGCYFC